MAFSLLRKLPATLPCRLCKFSFQPSQPTLLNNFVVSHPINFIRPFSNVISPSPNAIQKNQSNNNNNENKSKNNKVEKKHKKSRKAEEVVLNSYDYKGRQQAPNKKVFGNVRKGLTPKDHPKLWVHENGYTRKLLLRNRGGQHINTRPPKIKGEENIANAHAKYTTANALKLPFDPKASIIERYLSLSSLEDQAKDQLRSYTAYATASQAQIVSLRKLQLQQKYGKFQGDSGSTQVQIACLTESILNLERHFGLEHSRDKGSLRGLARKRSKRRALLLYLRKKNFEEYRQVVTDLRISESDIFNIGVLKSSGQQMKRTLAKA